MLGHNFITSVSGNCSGLIACRENGSKRNSTPDSYWKRAIGPNLFTPISWQPLCLCHTPDLKQICGKSIGLCLKYQRQFNVLPENRCQWRNSLRNAPQDIGHSRAGSCYLLSSFFTCGICLNLLEKTGTYPTIF